MTQRFFETVSTQLERWSERKIAEVEREAELISQKDKEELLQQISILEEELKKLKTNENAEKWHDTFSYSYLWRKKDKKLQIEHFILASAD